MKSSDTIVIENVFYMLAYAFDGVGMDEFRTVNKEDFSNADDLLSAIIHVGVSKLIRGGLHQRFEPVTRNLQTMRGQLNIQGTIRNYVSRRRVLECNYDEFTADNLFNQIVKTTIDILLRTSAVKPPRKRALRQLLPYFDEVTLIQPGGINWSALHYQRNNRSYVILINLCRLVIDGCLMGDKDGSGNLKLKLFTEKNLSWVFEKFVLEYYRKHHPEIEVPGAKELEWDATPADQQKLPKMVTDVMLKSGNKVLIIDTKFYGHILQHHFGGVSYHNGNIYQINTYVQSAKADHTYAGCVVEGMLLYALTNEAVTANSFTIFGNKISIGVLDLDKKFSGIAKQLDDIVDAWK